VRSAEDSSNLATLHASREQAVRICLDDFGVGYSSLSYLRSFPFKTLKIDRSFMREICSSRDAAAIVSAIVSLGTSLAMNVTAEGVEHPEQLELLKQLGCRQARAIFSARRGLPPRSTRWSIKVVACGRLRVGFESGGQGPPKIVLSIA